MPKPPPPSLPRTTTAAAATFDPWNSSSTGHQRPDHRPGTAWRDSRTRKVNSQFRGGEARIRGAWGSGTERHGSDKEARRVIGRRGASVVDMLKKPGLMKNMEESLGGDEKKKEKEKEKKQEKSREGDEIDVFAGSRKPRDEDGDARRRERGIFYGTVIYVNGSTYPLISDHKLKHLGPGESPSRKTVIRGALLECQDCRDGAGQCIRVVEFEGMT
ncbi:hypothetical protein QQS21_010177 [Conoideocrella luteorostrata]|uniref:Uncharacterized protein n=1 Tax=Conoideocrella luteorostrata TaxID=1105319 RepID=A0AAJ0FUF9_9HYPO|nr:hypothetical protein QQS21_010177 [Conoideocrella luteorostrata]